MRISKLNLLYAEMKSSILRITDADEVLLGTGFVISNHDGHTIVMTCGHIFKDSGAKICVDGRPANILLNKYSSGLDLAALEVRDEVYPPLKLAQHGRVNTAYVEGYTLLNSDIKKERISEITIKDEVTIYKGVDNLPVFHLKLYAKEKISKGYSGHLWCAVTPIWLLVWFVWS